MPGADIGEVIVTTAQIPEGDEDAWTAAWKATAERTAHRGEDSLEAGDPVSAREAFFRASSYYRSAEFYRRQDPLNDPAGSRAVRGCPGTTWSRRAGCWTGRSAR